MLFNSIEFLLFLPPVIFLYYLFPARYRWILLLAASYFFYMSWRAEYGLLLLFSTLVDYFTALRMERLPDRKARLPYLFISLVMNLGLLFFFKYLDFATGSTNVVFEKLGLDTRLPLFNLLLPVGISFYTFQTLSYAIDVYRGQQKAERHLGYFALYVSYFPQLVAGPIERFSSLNPQLHEAHRFSYTNISRGLRLILFGLFIKMVVADNLSLYVNQVYKTPDAYGTADIFTAWFFYSFQIYADFYGYSTVAVGSALLMGVKLMDNFRTPYLSRNIAEFWQRWHISLSTWFRDYLYYPMGGNKVDKLRWMLNIMTVFVVSGVWHGANWTFVIWGLLYGVLYIAEKQLNGLLKIDTNYRSFSVTHVFLVLKTTALVTLIWVFFRSQSLGEALHMLQLPFRKGVVATEQLHIPLFVWIFLLFFILSDIYLYSRRLDLRLDKWPLVLRWSLYSVLCYAIIVFSGLEDFPFIYFQF